MMIMTSSQNIIIFRQSKSVVLGIWETDELIASNNNLLDVGPVPEGEFIVSIAMMMLCIAV